MRYQKQILDLIFAYGIPYTTAIYLYIEYRKLSKRYTKLHDITTYLANIVDENDVALTEFDVIALTELGVKLKIRNEEPDA